MRGTRVGSSKSRWSGRIFWSNCLGFESRETEETAAHPAIQKFGRRPRLSDFWATKGVDHQRTRRFFTPLNVPSTENWRTIVFVLTWFSEVILGSTEVYRVEELRNRCWWDVVFKVVIEESSNPGLGTWPVQGWPKAIAEAAPVPGCPCKGWLAGSAKLWWGLELAWGGWLLMCSSALRASSQPHLFHSKKHTKIFKAISRDSQNCSIQLFLFELSGIMCSIFSVPDQHFTAEAGSFQSSCLLQNVWAISQDQPIPSLYLLHVHSLLLLFIISISLVPFFVSLSEICLEL